MHAIRDGGWTAIMLRHQRFAGHLEVDYHRAGSAASLLRPDDIPDELLRRAQIVHVTGITPALSQSACHAVFDAVERARSYRAIVCLDVNYRSKLWDPGQAVPVLRALAAGRTSCSPGSMRPASCLADWRTPLHANWPRPWLTWDPTRQ